MSTGLIQQPDWFQSVEILISHKLRYSEAEAWYEALGEAIPKDGLPEEGFDRIRKRFSQALSEQTPLPQIPESAVAIRAEIAGVVTVLQRCLAGELIGKQALATALAAVATSAANARASIMGARAARPESQRSGHYAMGAAPYDAQAIQAAWAEYFAWAADRLLAIIRDEVVNCESPKKPT